MKDMLDFDLAHIRWKGGIIRCIIALGAPSGVTQVILSMSFGNAMTTYAGQNMGAGNLKRTEEGAKQGTVLCL